MIKDQILQKINLGQIELKLKNQHILSLILHRLKNYPIQRAYPTSTKLILIEIYNNLIIKRFYILLKKVIILIKNSRLSIIFLNKILNYHKYQS